MHDTWVFVGTYSEPILQGTGEIIAGRGQGLYACQFDRETGKLTLRHVFREERNPSYLALDNRQSHLYVVNELKVYEGQASGAVSAFALNAASGHLTLLNRRPTGGTDPCHLCIAPGDSHVAVANYSGGSLSLFPILPDGSLGELCDFVQHTGSGVNPARQSEPHVHQALLDPTNGQLLAPDLGLDQVVQYQPDFLNGRLIPIEQASVAVAPGAGPRHGVFHPSGQRYYLICELDSTIRVFDRDHSTSGWSEIQVVSTLPVEFCGESSCSAIRVTPDGRYLIGANRGHDSLAIYRIQDTDGTLDLVGFQPTGGQIPRDFDVDSSGEYIIVGNQGSDSLVVFRFDRGTGKMAEVSRIEIPTPICIKIVD